ncbi:MAG: alpha-glucan family phosphorylase [Actinomycetota bacterium]|nr:alpha-glucan family phosphorylase [Actinomycetota bacterium]
MTKRFDGTRDLRRAVDRLARRLPEPLEDLAWISYNYLWSWTPGGVELFTTIDDHRFKLAGENPVRFLLNLPERDLLRAATDETYLELLHHVAQRMEADLARPTTRVLPSGPVAFFCAEFAVHQSLPVYSGGLGVLAGDYLKETSDQALDVVGVGLLYRRGYLHQRMDLSGWQHEYWVEANTGQLPIVRVRGGDGLPVKVKVPVWDSELSAQVWRVNVGRTTLFLLDTELKENTPLERWVTSRLYEGSHDIRLAQYALLGIGGVRALDAMGIHPGLFHMNEGHPALASLEIASQTAAELSGERPALTALLAQGRDRFAFTTHTPVPAGNETYSSDEFFRVLGHSIDEMGIAREELAALTRIDEGSTSEPMGFSPLAIKCSRSTNAVSRRHGEVARGMWNPLFPERSESDVPITYVTNGVHLPTWMNPTMRGLLSKVLGHDWERHADDPSLWSHVDEISDIDLWNARCQMRVALVEMIRDRIVVDRLARGEDVDLAVSGLEAFDPMNLTVGFARRLATYKRLDLLFRDVNRLRDIVDHDQGAQFIIAGKAHPLDNEAKTVAKNMFSVQRSMDLPNRVIFLEDYDMRVAPALVSGCDVWLNLPRPPMEASGTSGMKAAMNGGLNLSVLDGWWSEGYNGQNGWAIDGTTLDDPQAQDERDANALYDLLENEVKPMFFSRDSNGIPVVWLSRIRASLRSLAPMYSSARMLEDYTNRIYRPHPEK